MKERMNEREEKSSRRFEIFQKKKSNLSIGEPSSVMDFNLISFLSLDAAISLKGNIFLQDLRRKMERKD